MSPRKRGLGRGLDALLATQANQQPNESAETSTEIQTAEKKNLVNYKNSILTKKLNHPS